MALAVAVQVSSAAALAGVPFLNENSIACAERLDDIADRSACTLKNLDTDLPKAHERPQPDPFNHDYVSLYIT